MYRIIDKRSSGKTSRLMLIAKDTGATIVCLNPDAMRRKAENYGLIGLNFMSYGEFEFAAYADENFHDKKYLIDEMDLFLQHSAPIIGYTISDED